MRTHKEILKNTKIDRARSGFYISAIINTRGKGVPDYLVNYLDALMRESAGIFDVQAIFEQTSNRSFWEEQLGEKIDFSKGDTLYQLSCTLNIEGLSEQDFSDYMDMYIYDHITPFIEGCDFCMISTLLTYRVKKEFEKVASGGKRSIIIHGKEIDAKLYSVLKIVFMLSEENIDKVDSYFGMTGWCKIPNCVSEKRLSKLERFLREVNIQYEVE